MSLSKNQSKLIVSLQQKKYRTKSKLFVVEGIKGVGEFLNSKYSLETLFCLEDVVESYTKWNPQVIDEKDLKKVSTLKSPNKVLALFKIEDANFEKLNDDLTVVLDGVNDPGNLGTIIRLCDWYGVNNLICSTDTVDCYNSKVVQSTMGSLTRVNIVYTSVIEFLKNNDQPLFVTDMEGSNIYKTDLPNNGVVIMGNEANGVSKEVKELVNSKLTIPRFGDAQVTESLNVATATGIVLNEFRRIIQITK